MNGRIRAASNPCKRACAETSTARKRLHDVESPRELCAASPKCAANQVADLEGIDDPAAARSGALKDGVSECCGVRRVAMMSLRHRGAVIHGTNNDAHTSSRQ